MINEREAREIACAAGIEVSRRVKAKDGSAVVTVGAIEIRHNGRDGSACWTLPNGKRGYIGEAILAALS